MSVSVTPLAWADVRDIAVEWEIADPGGAREFFDRFEATLTILEQFPRLYGRVRRAPSGREIRCAPIRRTMYLAVYEVIDDEATIFSVAHARRHEPWRSRL
jgi:plasmid stabilization system protein ParE